MQENKKQDDATGKQTNQNERQQRKHRNHWRRENPCWNWMTPQGFSQTQTSYIPNVNFPSNGYINHFLNTSYTLASNEGYPHNQRCQTPSRWSNKSSKTNQNRNYNNRNVHAKFNRNQTKNTAFPCAAQRLSEKLKSIETSGKSFQKKSDISESEKERLRKVEEDRQRIKMALTKKDGITPLDFKSCISTLPNDEEMKETTTLKLSCPSISKIVLSESDFREIGIMNDRKDDDVTEDSNDGFNSQIDSEESSDDDCQIYSPEKTTNNDLQMLTCRMKELQEIQTFSEESLNECFPEQTNHEESQISPCSSKDNPEKQISEDCAIESDSNKESDSDAKIIEKKNKSKFKKDEVVLGYIERDENLHCVKKVENKLKELNNYNKILSMYRNFMRYRRFAKTDSSLYDRLKFNRSENMENPLLNREIVDRLNTYGVDKEKEHVETANAQTLESRANVEEVDEFIAIFGDLLDENCTIPAHALCRLGLESLIYESEENADASNDLFPNNTDSILCKSIKQEPADEIDEETYDEQKDSGLEARESIETIDASVIAQVKQVLDVKADVDENLNKLKDSVAKERLASSEMNTHCASMDIQRDNHHSSIPTPNFLDRNLIHSCDNSNSNSDNFTSTPVTEIRNRFPESLVGNRESQPAFDSTDYNKASQLEQMKVCHYIEKKMKCASILDCEPFEVAKSVTCSYVRDLLKLSRLSPVLDASFKNLLSMIKSLEQFDHFREKIPQSMQNSDYGEKRKFEHSNNDDGCSQHFKRIKRVEHTVKETFFNNRSSPSSEVDISKSDDVFKITDSEADSESESDDDALIDVKTSGSVNCGANESSANHVDINEKIQSAISSNSTSDCPTRIKTLKVYGEYLLLGCYDGKVLRLTKNCSKVRLYRGHADSVNCINGYRNMLLSGSSDGTVRVSYLLHPYISFHTFVLEEEVTSFEVMWGKLFVGTLNGSVFRCNIKNFENCTLNKIMVGSKNSPILDIKASREGPRKIIIVSVRSDPLTIRDARNGLLLHTFDIVDVVYSFAHSTSSSLVYCGTRNKSLVAVDLVTGCARKRFQLGKSVIKVILRSNLLYTAAYNGTVHVYSLKEDKILYTNSTPRPIVDMEVWCNEMVLVMNNYEVITLRLPSIEPISF